MQEYVTKEISLLKYFLDIFNYRFYCKIVSEGEIIDIESGRRHLALLPVDEYGIISDPY